MKRNQRFTVTVDNEQVFPSLNKAIKSVFGSTAKASGGLTKRVQEDRAVSYKGHTFSYGDTTTQPVQPAQPVDPLFAKLLERYSPQELAQIAKGEGISRNTTHYPEIHLKGKHHRMLVMSDTHIGSIYSPEEWHDTVSEFANDPANKIECILHCGDIVEGLKIGRAGTQIYELSAIGFDAQRDKAVELMSKYHKPIYIISGNHDFYFKEFAGANIVKAICDAVPNMTYIGHDSADIEIDGCTIRLFHGGDGSSYALSYRMQKLVEAINGGHKPNILLAGHTHKYVHIFERNIHAVSVPTMQAQTGFMRAKKLSAHTGFLVIDFDTLNGGIANFSVTLYPFYA